MYALYLPFSYIYLLDLKSELFVIIERGGTLIISFPPCPTEFKCVLNKIKKVNQIDNIVTHLDHKGEFGLFTCQLRRGQSSNHRRRKFQLEKAQLVVLCVLLIMVLMDCDSVFPLGKTHKDSEKSCSSFMVALLQ